MFEGARQASFTHESEQVANSCGQAVVLAKLLAQRQQCIAALFEHLAAQFAQVLGLEGCLAH